MTPPDAATVFVLLIRVTAILAVAWLVARSRWCGSAAIRHLVWFSALVASLLVPPVSAWFPAIHLPVPRISGLPTPEVLSGDPPSHASARISGSRGAIVSTGNPVRQAGEPHRSVPALDWSQIFVAIWISGGFMRLTWLAVLHSRTRRLTTRARRLTGRSPLQPLVDEIAGTVGVGRPVPVLVTPEVRMPLAWGLFQPVILLPADALRWSAERLRIVLLHELAHVRRRDYGSSLLSELVCILYWPSPTAWLARRELRVEQERACDDAVLSFGTSPLAYADHMLAIARAFYGQRRDLEMVVTMAREVSLKQRIRAILDDATDRRPLRSTGAFAISLVALGLYVPLTVVRGAEVAKAVAAPSPAPGAAGLAAATEVRASYLWLEAEAGIGNRSAYAYGDLNASNAEYVRLNPGAGPLGIEAELPTSGEYFVWARVSPRDGDPAALIVSVEGATPWPVRAPGDAGSTGDGWDWLRVMGGGVGTADESEGTLLAAGDHRFELGAAGADLNIDRILITTDATFTPSGKGPSETGIRTYLLLEGEEGVREGRLRPGRDPYASGKSFVVFREERRNAAAGTVEFSFDIPVSGRYLIWGRTYAENEESNSFHVSLDGGPEMIWDLPAAEERDKDLLWAWDPVSSRAGEGRTIDPLPFDLESGSHELRIRTREGGAHLDALLITSDLENRPEGLWPEALPVRPARLELRANDARLSGSIALRSDSVGYEPYLAVDEGGRARSPGASGLAAFEFDAAESGLYSVWARTVAPSSGQDSFWIRVNGGEWTLWNGIPRSSDWSWARVRDADAEGRLLQIRLDPGRHILEIAGREGGLKLDRLLVTNDPRFKPS